MNVYIFFLHGSWLPTDGMSSIPLVFFLYFFFCMMRYALVWTGMARAQVILFVVYAFIAIFYFQLPSAECAEFFFIVVRTYINISFLPLHRLLFKWIFI